MSVMGNEFSGLPIAELIGGPLTAACDAQVKLAKATSDFINTVGFNPALDSQGKIIPGKVEPRQVDFSFWQPLPVQKKYKVTGVAITNAGKGYSPNSTVNLTFTAPNTPSQPGDVTATGTVTTDANGVVIATSISITPGSGYTSAPTVTFPQPHTPSQTSDITATGTAIVEVDTSQSSETSVQKVMISVPFLAITNVPALMVKSVDIVFDMEVKSSESHKDESGYEAGMELSASGGWGPFSVGVKIHGSVSAHQENTRSTDRSAKYHVQVTARDEGMPEGLSRVLDILQKAIAPVSVSAAKSLKDANVGQKAITA